MKKTLVASVVALSALAAPAMAWEGRTIACYDKVWVPDEYTVTKKLHSAARTAWEHCANGQLAEVYYAPMYLEERHLKTPGHYVKRAAPCRD